MTKIAIPADFEAWARDQVTMGNASSVEAVVAQALDERRQMSDAHRSLVQQGYASLDKGNVTEESEVDAHLDQWIAEDRATAR